jgi:nucleotide-binding universal stress UspA family protein
MSYKTILVLMNHTSQAARLMDAAAAIARQYDAHVTGLYVLPAVKIYPEAGMMATPVVFEGYRDGFKSKLSKVHETFEAKARAENLSFEWRLIDSIHPDVSTSAIMSAYSADLVITSQIDDGPDGEIESDITERLVMEGGRPVLIIPRRGRFSPPGEGISEKAIIGINRSSEAMRAMFDSIPLLQMVKETRVVWVDPQQERSEAGDAPGTEEAEVLSRHGLKAVADPMVTGGQNAGQALLMRANDLGADLIVMGAYGHSRMREFVFGGATLHVLQNMNIPVLMSH